MEKTQFSNANPKEARVAILIPDKVFQAKAIIRDKIIHLVMKKWPIC